MRRILPLVSALMLMLVIWTGSAAHAAEAFSCAEVAASAEGHFDGDSDEVPADGDKAAPHHHSACHGHCVGTPQEAKKGAFPGAKDASMIASTAAFQFGNDPGTALRPPIA